MDPKLSEVFTNADANWMNKPKLPAKNEPDSPDVDEKTKNSLAYKVHLEKMEKIRKMKEDEKYAPYS